MASASSRAAPGAAGRPGGSRRRMRSRPFAVNDHVSRDAPPLSRCTSPISTGPMTGWRAAARSSDTDVGADRGVIDDLVEVLGQARALDAVVPPLRHALRDARDHVVAAVAQRNV